MIKFEHTVFALPFALIGALMASGGRPTGRQVGWILLAMVGARSAAMGFNRIVDLRFDRLNPRTSNRALPAGALSVGFTTVFVAASSALFVTAAWSLNPLCFYLSFPVLCILFLYSFTKRFTPWSHVVLGVAIGFAPLAAWLAIRGEFARTPILLSIAVMFWIAGFDILYALQDVDFDRKANLLSIPARFGVRRALTISSLFHVLTVALLAAAAFTAPSGAIAYVGIAAVAGVLFWEHRIVTPDDLSRIDVAFFNLNGYVGILLLLTFATDIWMR